MSYIKSLYEAYGYSSDDELLEAKSRPPIVAIVIQQLRLDLRNVDLWKQAHDEVHKHKLHITWEDMAGTLHTLMQIPPNRSGGQDFIVEVHSQARAGISAGEKVLSLRSIIGRGVHKLKAAVFSPGY